MTTFVSLDLDSRCCSCDYVRLFFSRACTGKPVVVLCHNTEIDPEVYGTNILSVQFRSDLYSEGTGFRLLFSFHHIPRLPSRLGNGKWDCTPPGASLWIQHFACSPFSFCDGGEDRSSDGCPSAELCGSSIITVGGGCYRYIKPVRKISWDTAESTCKASHGYLVSLNTQEEWNSTRSWFANDTEDGYSHSLIGLRFYVFPLRDT